MRELLSTIDAWQAEGLDIARAVVIRTYGSAPRREGSALLLASDGRIAGSVSGGCVEGATVTRLEEARTSGEQRVVRFGVSDEQAWEVGLACGGTIDVLVQPTIPAVVLSAVREVAAGGAGTLTATGYGEAPAARTPAAGGTTGSRALVTALPEGSPAPGPGGSVAGPAGPMAEPLVIAEADVVGGEVDLRADPSLVDAARTAILRGLSTTVEVAGQQHFIEVVAVRPRLVIVGGVPVAQALARLARELDHEVVVVDARPAFATRERFPDVDALIVGWPDEVADEIGLGPADAVAVLSHDPKVDEPAIHEALRRGCRYVGAIGSRKTQAGRRERLSEMGLDAGEVARLRGPIGLDLGGRSPAETALAIMAEIVVTRYGASAAPMRDPGARS
jgi:xanthine dehydrogenase accessory factor